MRLVHNTVKEFLTSQLVSDLQPSRLNQNYRVVLGKKNIVRHLSANGDDVNTQAGYYRVARGRLGTEVAQMLRDAGAVE